MSTLAARLPRADAGCGHGARTSTLDARALLFEPVEVLAASTPLDFANDVIGLFRLKDGFSLS